MAILTNAYNTYTAIGNREDLIDVITNISPEVTPVLSMTRSTRATARTHEWLTDVLSAPAANAYIEGDDTASVAVTAPTRVTNVTQILKKIYTVTQTQEAVDKAGRSSEVGYQAQNQMKALATDIEYAMVVNSAAVTGTTAVARVMNGLTGFIATNTSSATANRALTSTLLDALLQVVWAAGGNPDTILCGGAQKIAITGFTQNTKWVAAEKNAVYNSVDVYQSPFGTLRVILSHVMNTTLANNLYAVEMMKLRKAWLRPIIKEELAKTGDGRKFHVVAELTLEVLNEKAHGKMTQLI